MNQVWDRDKWIATVGVCLGLLVMIAAMVIACNSNPAGPKPKPAKDYAVYFADHDSPMFYEYHPSTNTLDSFQFTFDAPYGLAVSGDGSLLYVGSASSTVIVDAESRLAVGEILHVANRRPGLTVSPDGNFLAISGGAGVAIVETDSHTIVHKDAALGGGFFSHDSRLFCYALDSCIFGLDISTGTVEEIYCPGGSGIWRAVPTASGDRWFVYRSVFNCLYSFEVFDSAGDSLVLNWGVVPGLGQLALTPDGKRVIISQPGAYNCDDPAPSHLNIYDVGTNRMLDPVWTNRLADGTPTEHLPIDEMCITADGQWLVGLRALVGGFAVAIHVPSLTMQKFVFVGNDKSLHSISCQTKP